MKKLPLDIRDRAPRGREFYVSGLKERYFSTLDFITIARAISVVRGPGGGDALPFEIRGTARRAV
jgi:hypothetical protein